MSEEKKESKDVKKMKYEQPRLVKLSGAGGAGQCYNGSGDVDCAPGNRASSRCVNGNTAGGGCGIGNAADTTCLVGNSVVE